MGFYAGVGEQDIAEVNAAIYWQNKTDEEIVEAKDIAITAMWQQLDWVPPAHRLPYIDRFIDRVDDLVLNGAHMHVLIRTPITPSFKRRPVPFADARL